MTPHDFISVFQPHSNPENAQAMLAYMKGQFSYFGIKTPLRRQLFRQVIAEHSLPEDMESLQKLCKELYASPQRELHYCALQLLLKKKSLWTSDDLPFFEYLITHNSWWDTVDVIAPKILGLWFKNNPQAVLPAVKRWIASNHIWLQRSALLFQLKYKQDTNTQLMGDIILSLKYSREFFVQKAIGWLLREYAKTNPEYVLNFTRQHKLPALSQREALKHLNA